GGEPLLAALELAVGLAPGPERFIERGGTHAGAGGFARRRTARRVGAPTTRVCMRYGLGGTRRGASSPRKERPRAKRGNLEGSIHKRSDGRWVGVLHVGYVNGKRQRKYYYGETRRDVQQPLTAALRDQQQGIAPVSARLTVGTLLDEWLQAERISGKRVSGY